MSIELQVIIVLLVGLYCLILWSVEKICDTWLKIKRLDNGWNEQGTIMYFAHTDQKGMKVFNEFRDKQK